MPIEIEKPDFVPQTQADAAGVPPRRRVGVATGGSGDNGGIPEAFRNAFPEDGGWERQFTDQELDVAIILALDRRAQLEMKDPSVEPILLRGLGEVLEKYKILESVDQTPVSENQVREFLKEAKERGLIKRRGLSIIEYIRAILPRRSGVTR